MACECVNFCDDCGDCNCGGIKGRKHVDLRQRREMAELKFTTKPLTLDERIELNDVVEFKTDGNDKTVIVKNTFRYQVTAARLGLKTLNGIDVTPENVDELINNLSSADITTISDQVVGQANFSKKKKS
jgi:hypothetical protein